MGVGFHRRSLGDTSVPLFGALFLIYKRRETKLQELHSNVLVSGP